MNDGLVDKIVNAVLYEGYMLYPYRPSAVKNRQRFNFGVLYPRAYSEAQGGSDAWSMQTECLVVGSARTQCLVRARFLRMVERTLGKLAAPASELSRPVKAAIEKVDRLEVGNRILQPWQEAVEEAIDVMESNLSDLAGQAMQWPFRLSARQETEAVRDEQGLIAGVIWRDKANVEGVIDLEAEQVSPGVFRLRVRISNLGRIDGPSPVSRERALAQAFVSTHTILTLCEGEFVSLIDPPPAYRELAEACHNVGTWPVLVGEEGKRDTLLSSPIILYDYPQIAPESPGDLFDGAEIDEILSLRIMTLTEEEKAEIRQTDARARQILERTEGLPDEQLMKLHGVLRGLRLGSNPSPPSKEEMR